MSGLFSISGCAGELAEVGRHIPVRAGDAHGLLHEGDLERRQAVNGNVTSGAPSVL
jgi:hypothetical protein